MYCEPPLLRHTTLWERRPPQPLGALVYSIGRIHNDLPWFVSELPEKDYKDVFMRENLVNLNYSTGGQTEQTCSFLNI